MTPHPVFAVLAAALDARGQQPRRPLDVGAARALSQGDEIKAVLALVSLYAFGTHVLKPACAMLHPEVADDDWAKCNCWYGAARKIATTYNLPEFEAGSLNRRDVGA